MLLFRMITGRISLVLIVFCLLPYSCQGQTNPAKEKITAAVSSQAELIISAQTSDSLFFKQIINALETQPTNIESLLPRIGKEFLGKPYVASTLETPGEEHLIINLHEVDCTTLIEYMAAIALCKQKSQTGFEDFAQNLALLRYRDGIIEGYTSRLHYFSDWLINNEQKGILDIVTNAWGNQESNTRLSFMSSNPHLYMHLKTDMANQAAIKKVEDQLASHQLKQLSKDQIATYEHLIKPGDIIAFTTTIKGLDVSHTGMAYFHQGRLHLLHASATNKRVEITSQPLHDYLARLPRVNGIIVARIRE